MVKIAKSVIWVCVPCLILSFLVIVLAGFKVLQLDHSFELWMGGCLTACAFVSVAGAYVVLNDPPIDHNEGITH